MDKYQVDATGFDPVALKNTHRGKVASSRMKAEVKKHFAAKRKELQKRIKDVA